MKKFGMKSALMIPLLGLHLGIAGAALAGDGPVAWWAFEKDGAEIAINQVGKSTDPIEGTFKQCPGDLERNPPKPDDLVFQQDNFKCEHKPFIVCEDLLVWIELATEKPVTLELK
jgi:hypothetical protein